MPQSPLDQSRVSAHAWARYRRLMKLMAGITGVVVIGALAFFYFEGDQLPIHFYIATALGIGAAMMLMSALMGLVFLSSGTGHDEAVTDATRDDDHR
jgi:hypothetical protein